MTDSGGAALAEQQLILRPQLADEARGERRVVYSDAAGRLTIELPVGEWQLTARAKGQLASARFSISGGAVTEVSLQLQPGHAIRGRVVSARGLAVGGAAVDGAWTRADGLESQRVTTEADGSFELSELEQGAQVVLRVKSPDHPLEEVTATAPQEHLTVVLSDGRLIRARVWEANGQPALGCIVSLYSAGSEPTPAQFRERAAARSGQWEVTGSDGVATFRGLSSGPFVAYARREQRDGGPEGGFAWARVLATGPATDAELRLGLGEPLIGRVVDAQGAGVAGARVLIDLEGDTHERVTVGDGGRFEVALFTPGPWQLWAMSEGYRSARATASAGIGATLVLERGEALTGRVVDVSRTPINRFEVNDTRFDQREGRFSLPHLAMLRAPEVTISAAGYETVTRSIPIGQTDFGDTVLARGRTVTVTVLDAATLAPLADAAIEKPGEFTPSVIVVAGGVLRGLRTGADGTVELQAVGEGARLQISHRDFVTMQVVVPPGAATVRVLLESGGLVHVRIVGSQRVGPLQLTRWPATQQLVVTTSRDLLLRLSPGRYALRQWNPGDTRGFGRPFELSAGGKVEVELREAEGELLELKLVPSREPTLAVLVVGDVPAPATAAEWTWLHELAMQLRFVQGVARFPGLRPGRYTLFVDGYTEYHRQPLEHAAAAQSLEVRLPAELTPLPR